MAHDTRLRPRPPLPGHDWRAYVFIPLTAWVLLYSITGLLGLHPPERDPQTTAVLAAQYHALLQLRTPSLPEMANPLTADVQTLGQGTYQVRSWVAGSDRLGYPRRQAYTARVACPAGARRFEEWQLLDFRFE